MMESDGFSSLLRSKQRRLKQSKPSGRFVDGLFVKKRCSPKKEKN